MYCGSDISNTCYSLSCLPLLMLYSLCTDSTMYQYFVKIVPTAYVKIDGQVSILCLTLYHVCACLFFCPSISKQIGGVCMPELNLLIDWFIHSLNACVWVSVRELNIWTMKDLWPVSPVTITSYHASKNELSVVYTVHTQQAAHYRVRVRSLYILWLCSRRTVCEDDSDKVALPDKIVDLLRSCRHF